MSVRLGIIGTGRIAGRFLSDAWQKLDIQPGPVYNPNSKSAEEFALKHHLAFGTNDWTVFTKQIDAAYIASPQQTHGSYIRRLLEDGKHILCEKPMVLKEQEAEELFRIAKEKRIVLMEAVKTAYCPGFKALLRLVKEGRIGEIRDVEACFTKLADPESRELTDRQWGGSLTELGTYVCFAVLKILGCDYESLQFIVQHNNQGMDIFTKVLFTYKDNVRTGISKAGLGVKSEGTLLISGTRGYILVKAPWWLTRHIEVHYEDPDQYEKYEYPFEGNGLQYELEYFLKRIWGEQPENQDSEWESIRLAGIMERFLESEAGYRRQD